MKLINRPSKIDVVPLGNTLTFQRGYDLPTDKRVDGEYPVISSAGITGYHNQYKVDGEGIITGRYGTIGEMYYFSGRYWPLNTTLYVKDFKKNKPKYLYYLLKNMSSLDGRDKSTVPGVNRNVLHDIPVAFHKDPNDQGRIAAALSFIDDKIHLNNRIITELESMAKAIYDYWFVQFDFPDSEGKPYRSSGGKMIWNKKMNREIPKNWEIKHLAEIEPIIITGKTPSTQCPENYNGDIPFITIRDIRNKVFVISTEITLTQKGADLQPTKYIPEDSICVTCIASPGLVGFTTERSQTNQQINTVVCEDPYNKYFLYFAIKKHFKYSAGAKVGSTFANMNKDDFSSIEILRPDIGILKQYHEIIEPVFQKIKKAAIETKELIKLRDWLLPLLMNGQVALE